MIRIRVITPGDAKSGFHSRAEEDYLTRLRPWCRSAIDSVKVPKSSSLPVPERVARESSAMLAQVKPADYLVTLDERGTHLSSPQFAQHLGRTMNMGKSSFIFLIGGAYGLSDEARERADLVWSLSALTFPFQLVRLIVVEQIYRALSIMHGAPYHKA